MSIRRTCLTALLAVTVGTVAAPALPFVRFGLRLFVRDKDAAADHGFGGPPKYDFNVAIFGSA
ncbi:MAG: hypothetical protein AB3N20_20545, partial [Rhizobiaceae bacterium]